MPSALCDCGQHFPATPGAVCPRCGAPFRTVETTVVCVCTEVIVASIRWTLREVRCPSCGEGVEMAPVEEVRLAVVTRAAAGTGASPHRWYFLFFLIPLVLTTFIHDDWKARLKRTVDENPEAGRLLNEKVDPEEVLEQLPGHRIYGAWLSRESDLPWALALVALAGFAGCFRFLIPAGRASWKQLGLVSLFTGTVGIFMLLLLQAVAFSGSSGALLIIALMYILATHPAVGFVGSLIGFTFGVGLLEELCKAAPLVWRFGGGNSRLDLRGAAAWGIASGIGFGVTEALHYSFGMYNGLAVPGIYLVRFTACIALHGAWAGSSAVLMWRAQSALADTWGSWWKAMGSALIGPMVLHALYDTFLKKDWDFLALVIAAVSFVGFLWLYGRADEIEKTVPGLAV